MRRRFFTDSNIEIARRSRSGLPYARPLESLFMADFCLDLLTFKVIKNRHGANDLTPDEAYAMLCDCLERGERILLLTD